MKKAQKGLTLVEVLVATTVLTIVIFALLSTVLAMRKVVTRQEEYVKIKMVCQDIDVYLQRYGCEGWYEAYFKGEGENSNEGYLTAKFVPTANPNEAEYTITFQNVNNSISELSIFKNYDTPDVKVLVSGLDFPLKNEE